MNTIVYHHVTAAEDILYNLLAFFILTIIVMTKTKDITEVKKIGPNLSWYPELFLFSKEFTLCKYVREA